MSLYENKITIIICEHFLLTRKSLVKLLQSDRRIKVIGESSNNLELFEQLNTNLSDIVLLDVDIPQMNSKQTIAMLKKKFKSVKVIPMSCSTSPTLIIELFSLGVLSYISKMEDECELFNAIINVNSSKMYFTNLVSKAMMHKINCEKKKNPFTDYETLSEREIAVIKEICNGYTNKVISERLFITRRTVDFHKGNIYKKIKCSNSAEVVKYAIRMGIIETPLNI